MSDIKNKTLIIVVDLDLNSIGFAIIEGDYTELNGVSMSYIRQHGEKEEKVFDLLYGKNGIDKYISNDTSIILSKEYNHVAVITIY